MTCCEVTPDVQSLIREDIAIDMKWSRIVVHQTTSQSPLYHVLHYLAGKLHMVRGLQLLLSPAQATHF